MTGSMRPAALLVFLIVAAGPARPADPSEPIQVPSASQNVLFYEKVRQEAESSALACSLYAAGSVEDPAERAEVLIDIAGTFIETGKLDEVHAILSQAYGDVLACDTDWFLKQGLLVLIASRYGEAGQFDRAFSVAEAIANTEFRAAALTRVAVTLAARGEDVLASETVDRAVEEAKTVEGEFSIARTLFGIFEELLNAGMDGEAQKVAMAVEDDYFRSLILEELAIALSDAGRCDEALAAAEGITLPIGRVLTLNAVAARLHAQGRQKDVGLVLSQSLKVARTIEHDRGRVWYLIELGGRMGALGEKEKAMALLGEQLLKARKNKDPDKRVHLLCEIAGGYALSGETAKAREILASAHRIADMQVTGDFRDMELAKVAVTYVDIGSIDKGLGMVKDLEDDLVADSARVQIAFILLQRSRIEPALDMALAIGDSSRRDYVLGEVLVKMAERGECDRAFYLTDMIEEVDLELRVLTGIARFYAVGGEDYSAVVVLSRAADSARGMMEGRQRAERLADIVGLYLQIDLAQKALENIKQSTASEKAWVLKHIARQYDAYLEGHEAAASSSLLAVVQNL
jgi:tetratricopeptide (TPR) repeat protein